MTKNNKFYITAAIPYVNAEPHIGHALEFVQVDAISRYQKLLGKDVVSLSGGDENALKNVQAAEKACVEIQKFVDKNTETFFRLTKKINADFDVWQKGSDKNNHYPSVQKLWNLCQKSGDIYKKKYEGLYCVGCEAFYTPGELGKNNECPEHPGKKLQKISEENYFFRLSKYQNKIIEIIEKDTLKIIPRTRKNEVLSFLKEGLNDISISRSNKRAKNWGVPVPDDPSQIIYVWFDALNIYQSGIGFGWDENKYNQLWPADLHVIGKGITRFHAIYWPAFLLSAGLKLPKSIFIHGYFTVNGQKMSKTLGNVIDPFYLIEKYKADSLRYYFLAKFNPFTDGDFSEDKLLAVYNGELANGLGNLVSRIAKLCEKTDKDFNKSEESLLKSVEKSLINYRFDEALGHIWTKIRQLDRKIESKKPWNLKESDLHNFLEEAVATIRSISYNIGPFLPETSKAIKEQLKGPKIKSGKPLFPRIKK